MSSSPPATPVSKKARVELLDNNTPDVEWEKLPDKFIQRRPVEVVDLTSFSEHSGVGNSLNDEINSAPPRETDEEIDARVALAKFNFERKNYFGDKNVTIEVEATGDHERFSYHPLTLLPLEHRVSPEKEGPPCNDSCECFVGYDGSTGHDGLCYCNAVGICVVCDDDIFYCLRCVGHESHTRIAEHVAWLMND